MNVGTIACPLQYRQLMVQMLAFYRPMEESLAGVGSGDLGLDYTERQKTPLLISDLLALGASRQQIVNLPDAAIPDFAGPAGALGCCYVFEGATLGGQLIAKHLKDALGLDRRTGAAFFNGYGRATGAMWRSFCAVLNARVKDAPSYRAAAAAACATFELLEASLSCAAKTHCHGHAHTPT